MKVEFSKRVFQKYTDINFHANLQSGRRVVPCRRTDGQTDRLYEANSRFSQFCKCA